MCPLRMDEELSAMLHSHVTHSHGSLAGVLPPSTDKMPGHESLYAAPYTVVQLQGFAAGGMVTGMGEMSPPPRPQGVLGGRRAPPPPPLQQQRWEGYGGRKFMLDANNEVVDVSSRIISGVVLQSEDPQAGSPNRGNLSRYHSAPSAMLAGLVDDIREQGEGSYTSDLDNLSELMVNKRCDPTALGTLAEAADDEEPDSSTKDGGRVEDYQKYEMGLPQQRYAIPIVPGAVWPGQASPGSAGSNNQVSGEFFGDPAVKVGSGSPLQQEASEPSLKRNSLQRHGSCPADFLDKLVIEEAEQMEGVQRPFLLETLARSPAKNVSGILSLEGNSSAREQLAMYARDEVMRDVLSPSDPGSKSSWNAADLGKNWFCASGSDQTLMRAQALDPQSSNSTLTRFASLPSSLKPRSPQYGDTSIPCRTRAKRGCATHPRSIAERVRRTRIGERMKRLQELLPNLDKQSNTADMLDEAVDYIKELKCRVEDLENKVEEMTIRSHTTP